MFDFNSANLTIVVGKLITYDKGKPVAKETGNGKTICSFSVVTSTRGTDKNGNKIDKSTWFNVIVFGKMAEFVANYLDHNSMVCVRGKMQNNEYTDKNGVVNRSMQLLAGEVIPIFGTKRTDDRDVTHHAEVDDDEIPF